MYRKFLKIEHKIHHTNKGARLESLTQSELGLGRGKVSVS